MKQPMKKGSFVPKNVPGVGWGGMGWVWVMKGWGGVSCRGGVGWVKSLTQKIITHRVSKIHKWI